MHVTNLSPKEVTEIHLSNSCAYTSSLFQTSRKSRAVAICSRQGSEKRVQILLAGDEIVRGKNSLGQNRGCTLRLAASK